MSIEADNAALRIMLRAVAPNIYEVFEQAAKESGEPAGHFHLIIGHKVGGDLNNPKDHVIMIRNFLKPEIKAVVNQDPNRELDKQNQNMLNDLFPVAKQFISDAAEEWNVSPYNILLYLKVKYPEDPAKAKSIDLIMKTKKGIDPPREIKLS